MKDNRRHRKIDKLPESVIVAINDAIVNKRKTYKEIEKWLKDDGHKSVSCAKIWKKISGKA